MLQGNVNNFPTVAVLLAAYNGEKWLEEQLQTILDQENVCLDLYISLDFSTDNTLDIINKFTKQYTNITLLPYGQKFGGAAPNFYHLLLNVPIENYAYIALSDQDDIWLKNKLNEAIKLLESKSAFGYSGNVTAFWSDGRRQVIKKSYPQCEYDYLFEGPGPGCSFVLKQELALLIKIYLSSASFLHRLEWHDWLIYALARKNGFQWVIDNNSYILYRQHVKNQLGANIGYTAFIRRIKDVFSGYGINQTITIIKLLKMKNDSFVSNWYKRGRIKYLILSSYTNKCRRRPRDKIFFFFACFFMSILKINKIKDHFPLST